MEILNTAIKFALLIALIISPILLFNKLRKQSFKYPFILYLISAVLITFFLVMVLAWWSHFSTELLLSHYGYYSGDLNETERMKNVAVENLDKVNKLRISKMGIGWPLKAIMFYPFYFPYLVIVYLGMYFYSKKSNQKVSLQKDSIEF
jgi:Tfp pilus assembly protein PilO